MGKKLIYALVLILVTVVVLLLNARSRCDIQLGVTALRMSASFAYGLFAVLGVAIGLLLK
jgi:hypothetical protein